MDVVIDGVIDDGGREGGRDGWMFVLLKLHGCIRSYSLCQNAFGPTILFFFRVRNFAQLRTPTLIGIKHPPTLA